MASIALTGATGFVGRQILKALRAGGHEVRVLVRPGEGQVALSALAGLEVVVLSDVFQASDADLQSALQGIDTLIHAAWYVEPGLYLDASANLDCLVGTLRLAQALADVGGKRFVGIGTCFEYDLSESLLSVDTPLKPTTRYSAAKAATFKALEQVLPPQGVSFAWCRLFYLYGEGEDARRLVPYVHARLSAGEPVALTRGEQVRDFLDVARAGECIAEVALAPVQGAFNICSGMPITVRALVEGIADQYQRRDLLRFGERPDNALDPARVVGVPNFVSPTHAHATQENF